MSPDTPAWVKLALILGASNDPLADAVAEEKAGEREQLHHPGGR